MWKEAISQKIAVSSRYSKMQKMCEKRSLRSFERLETVSDDDSEYLGVIGTSADKKRAWMTTGKVNGVPGSLKIDTGADVTVIPEPEYRAFPRTSLSQAEARLWGPGKSCTRQVCSDLAIRQATSQQDLFVVRGLSHALLGRPAIEVLRLKYNIA